MHKLYGDGEPETTQEDKQALPEQKYKQKVNDEVEDLTNDTFLKEET